MQVFKLFFLLCLVAAAVIPTNCHAAAASVSSDADGFGVGTPAKQKITAPTKIPITINGAPVEIGYNESAYIAQTLDGYMVLTLQNDPPNSKAIVYYSSGGSPAKEVDIDSGLAVPQLIVNNWQSNNLQITNLSENKQVKVKVGLYGHGVPTYHLPIGPKVTLNQYQSCSGRTLANDMALRFTTQTQHQYTVMFLFTIGEPAAYCLNAPDPDKIPKKGYPYITTSNNYKTIIQNWMGNPLFIINTSPAPGPVEVFLKGL